MAIFKFSYEILLFKKLFEIRFRPSNSTKVNGNDDTITEMSNYIIDEGHSRAHHFSTRATSTKKTVAQIKVEKAKRLMRENSTRKNAATIVEVGTYKERVREKERYKKLFYYFYDLL